MKNFRKNQGITLIALVITVIVLLILAGVSIATLTGDNGLLSKAQEAKEETEKKTHKKLSRKERDELIAKLTAEMHAAANILEFEHAAYLRDRIEKLKSKG